MTCIQLSSLFALLVACEGTPSDSADSDVEVELSGASTDWSLGMADTLAADNGWFGETCVEGAERWEWADDRGVDICHSLGSGGAVIESVYPDVEAVADGQTLFDPSFDEALTYLLRSPSTGQCATWGEMPAYYDHLGCRVLELP